MTGNPFGVPVRITEGDEYNGTCLILRHGGPWGEYLLIQRADPKIRMTVQGLRVAQEGGYVTTGPDGLPYIRIMAQNGTVVYRIVSYDITRGYYHAEWPD